jgi:hypothetical protein
VTEGGISRDDAARRIVEVVESFGLQVVEPPPALEPILEDDVGVICWMAVLPPASPVLPESGHRNRPSSIPDAMP